MSPTKTQLLTVIPAGEVDAARVDPVDPDALAQAASVARDVQREGEAALRRYAERWGDAEPGAPLVLGPAELEAAFNALPSEQRDLLQRTAERIRFFARAQRDALRDVDVPVPGGRAGHTVRPVQRAGCYAPGGRFPLPSSVLMTAVTARVAGVSEVWVASPRPAEVTKAAAHVAGADALLTVGGAQAVAALAYGAGPVPAVDVICGPGNRYVTAAKQLVAGRVRIDMLAGPSELVVLADGDADPALIAADLLAQAEHDPDARPLLVTWSAPQIDRVQAELARQLAELPTADTARAAVEANGLAVLCADVDEAVTVCDRLAPEHLEVLTQDAVALSARLSHYGGLFVGAGSAEVLGDYGAGPNHVLPTGATARNTGGLSVLTFLAVRTWLRLDAPDELARDARGLARLEGLEGHARSAEARLDPGA